MTTHIRRLSAADRVNLRIEGPETPVHFAALCVVEGAGTLGSTAPDLAAVDRGLEARLERAPELRQIVHPSGPLAGPPIWVDDPEFSLVRHVLTTTCPAPGDETAMLATALSLLRRPLDRSHPLWRIWVMTGLERGRTAFLFQIHHAVADGLAAVALLSSLLDAAPADAPPDGAGWTPVPPPPWRTLAADALAGRCRSLARRVRRPSALARSVAGLARGSVLVIRDRSGAPQTSLNRPAGPDRRERVVRFDLEEVRAAAHRSGGRVNDVVLALISRGMRQVLRSRGELAQGMELRVSMPVSTRAPGTGRELGNRSGVVLVRLPLSAGGMAALVGEVARRTVDARREQRPDHMQGMFAMAAALGLAGAVERRQHMVNFFVSNVPGPRETVHLLGSPIVDIVPMMGLIGNVTVLFQVLSYRGRLNVGIQVDAGAWADLELLTGAMDAAWEELRAAGG